MVSNGRRITSFSQSASDIASGFTFAGDDLYDLLKGAIAPIFLATFFTFILRSFGAMDTRAECVMTVARFGWARRDGRKK
jgi:hypothetical protein